MACQGRDAGGDHCCWVEGEVCPLLVYVGGQPRCSVWGDMRGNPVWESAPVARFLSRYGPHVTCEDWPQNIPEVMERGIGLCCWQKG